MSRRTSQVLCLLLLTGSACAGKRESTPASNKPEPTPPPAAAPDKPGSCPAISLVLHPSEPPIELRLKMRSTSDGEVIDQIIVSRTEPALHQTLQVKDVDALSVLDKCAVRTSDVNFDGYHDIFVDLRAGAANGYAQYWYYDPAARAFKELGEYPEFQVDAQRKRLKTYERNGSGGQEYEAKEYSFAGGALVLERQEVQVPLANEDAFERTVSVRNGAELKVVEKKRVAAADGR